MNIIKSLIKKLSRVRKHPRRIETDIEAQDRFISHLKASLKGHEWRYKHPGTENRRALQSKVDQTKNAIQNAIIKRRVMAARNETAQKW